MTSYQVPMYERLEPRTPFKGGRITDTDVLTLSEAARFASVHAGTEITPADILRAGARGEIPLAAIVHQRAKVQKPGGGVCINEGHPTDENVIPKGAIPTLPLKACKQLAAAGHASWRTFDGFKNVEGELCRYTKFKLTDDEPDFVTTPEDCRLTGYNLHALADAFIDETAPEQDTATPAPVLNDEVDFTMVATRKELIDAFGRFTEMNMTWFDNLTDAPRLKAARKFTGQGGRQSAEPLFCPYEVMQWLADPKRKKGKTLSDTTAWRLLKNHFPKVYNQYSIGDPNAV